MKTLKVLLFTVALAIGVVVVSTAAVAQTVLHPMSSKSLSKVNKGLKIPDAGRR